MNEVQSDPVRGNKVQRSSVRGNKVRGKKVPSTTLKYHQQIRTAYAKKEWDVIRKLADIEEVKHPKKPDLKILSIILKAKSLGNSKIKHISNKTPRSKTKSPRRSPKKSPKLGFSPPFKWAGSKRRLLKFFDDIFFPPGEIKTFVDMFSGSTVVSMWVASKYPKAKIILNDENKELMDMYRVIRDQYSKFEAEFLKIVEALPKDPEERKKFYYEEVRDEYCHDYEELSAVRLAANLYFMLKTNFGGLWKSGKHCNYRYSTAPGAMNFGPNFLDVEPIREFSRFLKRCELYTGDFDKMDKFGGVGTYFYADPPYISSTVTYEGEYVFLKEDQIHLINFLKDMGDLGSWFAESNRDIGDGFWEKHFKDETIHHIKDITYTAGRGATTKSDEILVTNF